MNRFATLAVLGLSVLAAASMPATPSVCGWRGDGSGIFPDASPPLEWDAKKNIQWRASVGKGHASPVVTGDRVIVVSEPGTLLCLGRADGKVLWQATLDENLPAEIKEQAHVPPGTEERVRATPVTDGRSIYVSLCTGIVACYSVEGKRAWVRYVEPPRLPYGPSASPVLVGKTLLVDSKRLTALDAATGRMLWKASDGDPHYGSPAILSLEGAAFAVTAKGAVVRVSDGAVLAKDIAPGLGGDQSPTPVVQDGVVYFAYRRSSAVRLTIKEGAVRSEILWERQLPGDVIASPVVKDGLLFVIPSEEPVYHVLDQRTGEILLRKDLDLPPSFIPSLAVAGNRLFLGNDKGDTLVLEVAREFRIIRRNELPEGACASPAFSGAHLFLRGGKDLYCIGPGSSSASLKE